MTRTLFVTLSIIMIIGLGGCSTPSTPATESNTTAPATVDTSSAQRDDGPSDTTSSSSIQQLNAIIPQTMAFGAPMVTYGKNGFVNNITKNHTVSNWDSVEQLKGALINGEAELAATPAYVAANLYNKGVDIRLVGPVVWGMLYVVGPADATPGDWNALKGKKVAITSPNNMPDLVFTYLLQHNGLSKDDIIPVNTEDGQQAMQLFLSGEVEWVLMPEHAVTITESKAKEQGINTKRVFDLQDEWAKITGKTSRFPMAGLVMPGKIVDEHPEAVQAVIDEVKAGVEKANAGDPEAIKAIAQHYELPEAVVTSVIPRLQLDMVPASAARAEYEDFLTRLGEVSPDIYGGKLPDDTFYAGK